MSVSHHPLFHLSQLLGLLSFSFCIYLITCIEFVQILVQIGGFLYTSDACPSQRKTLKLFESWQETLKIIKSKLAARKISEKYCEIEEYLLINSSFLQCIFRMNNQNIGETHNDRQQCILYEAVRHNQQQGKKTCLTQRGSLKEASLLGSEQKKKKSNPKNKPKTNPKQPKNPKQQKNVLTQRQNIRPTHSTFIPAIASYLKKTLLKVNQRLFQQRIQSSRNSMVEQLKPYFTKQHGVILQFQVEGDNFVKIALSYSKLRKVSQRRNPLWQSPSILMESKAREGEVEINRGKEEQERIGGRTD